MKTDLIPIDENTQLILNKIYPVRCALMNTGAIVPIYGNKHRDPDLAVKEEHYHIDGKFYVAKSIKQFLRIDDNGRTNNILNAEKYD